MIPITSSFPAALFFYWITSNIITLLQTVIFRSNAVRRRLNIPIVSIKTIADGSARGNPGMSIAGKLTFAESKKALKEAENLRELSIAGHK